MSAKTIREVRAMLASQACELDERTPPLARTLSFWLAARASAPPRERAIPLTETYASLSPPLRPALLDAVVKSSGSGDPRRDCHQISALPPELELFGFSPRRSEFGQRLQHPQERRVKGDLEQGSAEVEPASRIQPITADEQIREIKLRRPLLGPRSFHAADAETPFFPSDLADEPSPLTTAPPIPFLTRHNARGVAPGALALAKTFHLAELAARLAAEEVRIADRLADLSDPGARERAR